MVFLLRALGLALPQLTHDFARPRCKCVRSSIYCLKPSVTHRRTPPHVPRRFEYIVCRCRVLGPVIFGDFARVEGSGLASPDPRILSVRVPWRERRKLRGSRSSHRTGRPPLTDLPMTLPVALARLRSKSQRFVRLIQRQKWLGHGAFILRAYTSRSNLEAVGHTCVKFLYPSQEKPQHIDVLTNKILQGSAAPRPKHHPAADYGLRGFRPRRAALTGPPIGS